MSSWWEAQFSVTGASGRVYQLVKELPSLRAVVQRPMFDNVKVVSPDGCLVHATITVTRNYAMPEALAELVSLYRDLIFAGVMWHQSWEQDGSYALFSNVPTRAIEGGGMNFATGEITFIQHEGGWDHDGWTPELRAMREKELRRVEEQRTAPRYRITLSPRAEEVGGGWLAGVPELPVALAEGVTPQEALDNIMDSIASWTAANTISNEEELEDIDGLAERVRERRLAEEEAGPDPRPNVTRSIVEKIKARQNADKIAG